MTIELTFPCTVFTQRTTVKNQAMDRLRSWLDGCKRFDTHNDSGELIKSEIHFPSEVYERTLKT